MEIKQIQAIEGANIYSYRPIIRAILDLQDWAGKLSNEIENFNFNLVKLLPTLAEHYCSKGRPGGFIERLKEGTLLGHVVEHVTIDLLTLADQKIPYGKTMSIPNCPTQYEIIFNYESKEGAILAFKLAVNLVRDILNNAEVDVTSLVGLIKQEIAETGFGASTRAIVEACQKRGIPVQKLSEGSLLQLGYGRNQRRVQAAMTDLTSCIGVDIACDKGFTKKLLGESGVPVPHGLVVRTEDEAVLAFKELGTQGVVKPYNGNQGKGVSLRLETEAEIRAAFNLAKVYGEYVIVEEYIKGRNYRLLVIGGKLVAAAERIPAHVIGDGKLTINQLVETANQNPMRGDDHEKALTKIKIDPVVILNLAQKNLSTDSIPNEGEVVYLRDSANLSTGGIAHDVTELVHPDNVVLVEYVAKIIGLDIAGIDFVLEDISSSWRKQNGKVIEVNAAPGIRMHHFPASGKSIDIGKIIVDQVIPTGNARIPIVSITGTNGKTTTTRMIGKMLLDQKLAVGMTTTDGIYVNGKLLLEGDTTGPDSARIILRHPEVQVAVLETARGGLLRAGLVYDYADVAVITNVANDHLGQYAVETLEDLAHVKSLVAEVVKPYSYVVLNADDPYVVQMTRKTKGRVILFSTEKDNIHVRKHLGLGGTAVFVRRGYIIVCQGSQTFKICSIKQLPVTYEGRAKHNLQNALAATAAGWALGLNAENIRQSLEKFTSDPEINRGRLNFYDINGIKVCVDYGHNAAGIEQVIHTLKKFKGRSLVGCITVPGDRTDDTIKEVAKVAAKGFDRLIIKEDADLRGRNPGEVAKLIYDEALAHGMSEKNLSIILPELDAFKFGLDSCRPRDIFTVFYEKLDPIEEEIKIRMSKAHAFSIEPAGEAAGI